MINPVFKKEILSKGRSWKNTAMITLYSTVIVFCAIVAFKIIEQETFYGYGFSPSTFQGLYITVSVIQIFLIGLLVPASTASSINGEKQRRTFDILICTKLKPLKIIQGKLLATIFQTVILLTLALPVFSCLFLFGGVEVLDLVKLMVFFVMTAVLVGSIGIYCSTSFKKSSVAIVISYLIIFALTFGMIILFLIMTEVFDIEIANSIFYVLFHFNPGTGLSAILSPQMGKSFIFLSMIDLKVEMLDANIILALNLLAEAVLSLGFILAAARKIDPLNGKRK